MIGTKFWTFKQPSRLLFETSIGSFRCRKFATRVQFAAGAILQDFAAPNPGVVSILRTDVKAGFLSRRDNRTEPGVLTPGTDKKGTRPEGGGREAFSVLECRTRSSTNFCRPCGAGPYCQYVLGLKPQALSYSPFLLRHPELRRTGRDKEFYRI